MAGKNVEVPQKIYDVLSKRSEEKGFDNTDEYVEYVLGQVADKIERQHSDEKQEFSKEDEEKVKERLRNLGYLD